MTTRRGVLLWTIALMALPVACRIATSPADSATDSGRAAEPLDILFLGGTGFLGPH
jgi:hypothetical protein